ncbi:MAG: hypothetical protein ACRDWI_08695 [Jiangellaceae bacterium]
MLELSSQARTLAGVLLLTLVAVEFGWYLTKIARGQVPMTDFQRSFARAGHGHAGMLVTLGLVCVVLADATDLDGFALTVARGGVPLAAILMPAGFFFSSMGREVTRANRMIWLVWLGAVSLAGRCRHPRRRPAHGVTPGAAWEDDRDRRRRAPPTMSRVRFEQAKSLLDAFEREGVRYVLIGSMAMAAQGVVRATQDIDFFVAPEPGNVERVKRALRSVFHDESIDEIDSADLAGPYPVIRYGPPDSQLAIDLVGRLGDAFAFDDIEAQLIDIDGTAVPVATPRMLYRMKRDTVRPQDRADAEILRERFDLEVD